MRETNAGAALDPGRIARLYERHQARLGSLAVGRTRWRGYHGATVPREFPPIEPDPVIEAYKKDVDRTLIRENLKLTPTQRVEKLIELQRFAKELRRAGDELRRRKRDGGLPRSP